MNDYRKLKIWHESMILASLVYQETRDFPKAELYGIVSQIRKSVVSIPSNIAEGACRNGRKEFNQFLGIANGSAGELDTQIEIAHRLSYLPLPAYEDIRNKIASLQKMICQLQRKLSEQPDIAPKAAKKYFSSRQTR
jgi:four helix bundle protein